MTEFLEIKTQTVLSTTKLATHQKQLLLNAGLGYVEFDAISINPISFELPEIPENLIFSSKNSVKAILQHPDIKTLKKKKCFAIGVKTSVFLRENGFTIARISNYAKDLASEINEFHKNEEFLFFCGKKRLPVLPSELKKNGFVISEVEVYDTVLTPKKFDRIFDGVLFFSPSGVKSFCSKNDLSKSIAICIGNTTASEAKKHTKEIIIATKPSIENVIVQAIKRFG